MDRPWRRAAARAIGVSRRRFPVALALAAGLLLGAPSAYLWQRRYAIVSEPSPAGRLSLPCRRRRGSRLRDQRHQRRRRRLALAPDGQTLAFVVSDRQGITRLWVRPLDRAAGRVLRGTEGASSNHSSGHRTAVVSVSSPREILKWTAIDDEAPPQSDWPSAARFARGRVGTAGRHPVLRREVGGAEPHRSSRRAAGRADAGRSGRHGAVARIPARRFAVVPDETRGPRTTRHLCDAAGFRAAATVGRDRTGRATTVPTTCCSSMALR